MGREYWVSSNNLFLSVFSRLRKKFNPRLSTIPQDPARQLTLFLFSAQTIQKRSVISLIRLTSIANAVSRWQLVIDTRFLKHLSDAFPPSNPLKHCHLTLPYNRQFPVTMNKL